MPDNTPLPSHHPSRPLLRGSEEALQTYKAELTTELDHIITYWKKYTPDKVNGGFLGKIDNDNQVTADASKGSVLNARILWSFSAAYNLKPDAESLTMTHRVYEYIDRKSVV